MTSRCVFPNGVFHRRFGIASHYWLRIRSLSIAAMLGVQSTLAIGIAVYCPRSTAAQAPDMFDAVIESVIASECGIDFVHTDGGCGKRYIIETVLGSLALFDYDQDGKIDIYFINGALTPGCSSDDLPLTAKRSNRLYRNLGEWKFEDVTEESGLGDTKYGMGVVVGDYNNNGLADVFVTNFGSNSFYINGGDGTFVEASEPCGINGPDRFGAGSTFIDIDGNGNLDLYTASYVEFDINDHRTRTIGGYEFHIGPNDLPPARDFLYRNQGDGTFTDISESAGITVKSAPGMGVLTFDVDRDGHQDIFVANDQQPNFVWINGGAGNFVDNGVVAGLAYDRLGNPNGNMGADVADVDGDLEIDLVTTNYQDEMPVLYLSLAPGIFEDVTSERRLDRGLYPHVNWGVGAEDFDNDGLRELFFACGHFLDNIERIDDRTQLKNLNYLLAQNEYGKFHRVPAARGGDFLGIRESSRGAAFADIDGDGDQDMIVLNVNASPSIGRTRTRQPNYGLSCKLVGTRSNRSAIGTIVIAETEDKKRQIAHKLSSRGYEGYYGSLIHFGIADKHTVTFIVNWPRGGTEEFTWERDAEGSTTAILVEGSGRCLNN